MHLAQLAASKGAGDWPLHAVIAHAGAFGVVLSNDGNRPCVATIQHQSEPLYRSDVLIDDLNDLAAMALPGGRYLIRTMKTQPWPSGVVVGRCPPGVVRAIQLAVRREVDARALESKYRKASDMPDALVQLLAPGVRRAGVHVA